MEAVWIHPRYQPLLDSEGLRRASDFLALDGSIVGGHADRNVARVELGQGARRVTAYLKREHRVRWKERLGNALAGFGHASKSEREAATLRGLCQTRIGAPEPIAVGTDRHGRAFLLVRAIPDAIDLASFVAQLAGQPAATRRAFARHLGRVIAEISVAGYDHRDLYVKHILVEPATWAIQCIDWQRSRRCTRGQLRIRDLAALDASLPLEVASGRERLSFLRSYQQVLSAGGTCGDGRNSLRCAVARIVRRRNRLLRRSRIRDMHRRATVTAGPSVRWLDGEALCVTPALERRLPGGPPDWLHCPRGGMGTSNRVCRQEVELEHRFPALLTERVQTSILKGVLAFLRGGRLTSPELRQADVLFRLQRHGVRAADVLAFGQRQRWPWRCESFLLIGQTSEVVPLSRWLAEGSAGRIPAARRNVLIQAGKTLHALAEAGYVVRPGRSPATVETLLVTRDGTQQWEVRVGDVGGLRRRHRGSQQQQDVLGTVTAWFEVLELSRTERVYFWWGFLSQIDLQAPGSWSWREESYHRPATDGPPDPSLVAGDGQTANWRTHAERRFIALPQERKVAA